jgi:methylthioribose-1-phosphate isomerase
VHVYVDETRPVGQGARLTYWELLQNKIPATLLTDNMSAMLMQQNKVDLVIVGADRIARNGDIANKIGTYNLAVLSHFHKIPFYVAAPLSSFDISLEEGSSIPIEYRDKQEVLGFWNIHDHDNFEVFNPAFDITPHNLITGIITDKGVVKAPYTKNITQLFNNLF